MTSPALSAFQALAAPGGALASIALLFLVACSPESSSHREGSGKPIVYVPVPPYAETVERIAGDLVEVETLVSETDDPHGYSPSPADVARLAEATIYFSGDFTFERTLLDKLEESDSEIEIVNLVEGLDRRGAGKGGHGHEHEHSHAQGESGDGHSHSHEHDDGTKHSHEHGGEAHEHGHEHEGDQEHEHEHEHEQGHEHGGALDPHVWLAPGLLLRQTDRIAAALQEVLPSRQHIDTIEQNRRAYAEAITEVDKELVESLSPLRGQSFYVYHGAFGYFADAYGLEQVTVEVGGRSPEPKRIVELEKMARKEGVSVIFVQPQFDDSSAEALADSIGGTVVSIDPLARDVLGNLRDVAAKLQAR